MPDNLRGVIRHLLEKRSRAALPAADDAGAGFARQCTRARGSYFRAYYFPQAAFTRRRLLTRRNAWLAACACAVRESFRYPWRFRANFARPKAHAVLQLEIGGDPANGAFCEGLPNRNQLAHQLEQFHNTLRSSPQRVRRQAIRSASDARRAST